MSFGELAICTYCKHYDRSPGGPWKCAAFPDEIPQEIVRGKVEHTTPYPGDHGIQFEVAESEREDYEEYLRFIEETAVIHEQNIRDGIISR